VDVVFAASKDRVRMSSNGSDYELFSMNAKDWPSIPKPSASLQAIEIPGERLAIAIKAVRHALSQDGHRPHLSSLCLDFTLEGLNVFATDGCRAARDRLGDVRVANPMKILVPQAAVTALHKVSSKANTVHVGVEGTTLYFWDAEDGYRAQVAEATPVDVARFFTAGKWSTTVVKDSIVDALKRVLIVHNDARLDFSDGKLEIFAADSLVGKGQEVVETTSEIPKQSLHLSVPFLLDSLMSAAGPDVLLSISDDTSPILVEDKGRTYQAILMPMRPNVA